MLVLQIRKFVQKLQPHCFVYLICISAYLLRHVTSSYSFSFSQFLLFIAFHSTTRVCLWKKNQHCVPIPWTQQCVLFYVDGHCICVMRRAIYIISVSPNTQTHLWNYVSPCIIRDSKRVLIKRTHTKRLLWTVQMCVHFLGESTCELQPT